MLFDDVFWLTWLLLLFLPFEIWMALDKKPGGTLSENVWEWIALRKKDAKYGRTRRFILMGFLVSLAAHFVFETMVIWVILFGIGVAASIAYHYVFERREK